MSVFKSVYANQYDNFYAQKDYNAEAQIAIDAAIRYQKKLPNSILDVGCGTGGHAIELALKGFSVTGVDLSQSMLDCAQIKADAKGVSKEINLIQGDIRNFETGSKYDLAIMMFAVIGYLTSNSDVVEGLRNIRNHLNEHALLVCDFWYGPSVLSVRPTDKFRVLDSHNGQVLRSASTSLNIPMHTADVSFKVWEIDNGHLESQSEEVHSLRYFYPLEFAMFLELSGFELISISAFPSLDESVSDETWNALVVAKAV